MRSFDPIERIAGGLTYLAEENGEKTPEGIALKITAEDIHQLTFAPMEAIEACLNYMLEVKILHKTKTGYLLTDINAITQIYSDMKERVAA